MGRRSNVETIDFPAIEDLLGMTDTFFSKENVIEELKLGGFNAAGRLALDLGKLGVSKLPVIGGRTEWYMQLAQVALLGGAGIAAGYYARQKVGRDAGMILSATILGGLLYDKAVVPAAVKMLPASITGSLGAVEVQEQHRLLGELTVQERRMLGSTSVEDEFRQLGALTVEPRQLGDGAGDDDDEVVLGGGFNQNHGSLAAVLAY